MLAAGAVRVEAVSADELVVSLPSACSDPEFIRQVQRFVAWAARPGARLARRDALIRELATHYGGSRKARAVALLGDANRYAATAWRQHRKLACCPAELVDTPQELMWLVFKQHDYIPISWRMIWNIIR